MNIISVSLKPKNIIFGNILPQKYRTQWTIALKIAMRNFLRRCIGFFHWIPIESVKVLKWKPLHLGKNSSLLSLSAIVYWTFSTLLHHPVLLKCNNCICNRAFASWVTGKYTVNIPVCSAIRRHSVAQLTCCTEAERIPWISDSC